MLAISTTSLRFAFGVLLLTIVVLGCSGSTPVADDGDDRVQEPADAPPENTDEPSMNVEEAAVAGHYNSIQFANAFTANPDEIVGKVWDVSGFMNKRRTEFRVYDVTAPIVMFELGQAASEEAWHPRREITVRGLAEAGTLGNVRLVNATILSDGEDPDKHVSDVRDAFDLFANSQDYARLKYDFRREFDAPPFPMPKFRGRVVSLIGSVPELNAYLDAGQDRFVLVQMKDKAAPDFTIGAETTFAGRLAGPGDKDVEHSMLFLREAELVEGSEPSEAIFDESTMLRFTANELFERATSDPAAFRQQVVLREWPEFWGGVYDVFKPVIVTGVVKEAPQAPYQIFHFADADSESKLSVMPLGTANLDGIQVGDEVTIIGVCEQFDATENDRDIRVNKARIWNQQRNADSPLGSRPTE